MSNFGLEAALAREGIAFRRSAVGDRNVARLMDETGAALGGETSGHVLLAPALAGRRRDPDRPRSCPTIVPRERAAPVGARDARKDAPDAAQRPRRRAARPSRRPRPSCSAVGRAEEALRARGRVFLRYSGTEPLLRILVEGPEAAEVKAVADELEATVREPAARA